MTPKTELLLSRLTKVRQSVPGQWTAICPGHEDKSPSLSVRECDDGRILLHCFSGCEVSDVLAAVGLSFRDLFPDRLLTPEFKPALKWHPITVLRAMAHDVFAIALLTNEVAERGSATMQERDDLFQRAGSILAAVRLAVNENGGKYHEAG